MIRVFKATDTNYISNGEKIIKPIEAVITKSTKEEYLELECKLEYADFLVQDNILIVDTLTGKKGYKIHNPIISNTVYVKAWLCYQEKTVSGADRGVVISHGKNLVNCEVEENWDNVVTKLIPVGYNETKLPEGYISVPTPYQKVYEKTIEFELPEELLEEIEVLEQTIEDNESIKAGLENSLTILQAKYNSYDTSITSLQDEKAYLEQRLSELGDSEPELKEKAVIEAQLPLIAENITQLTNEKANILTALQNNLTELDTISTELIHKQTDYSSRIINDLRAQAQAYLNVNQYPQINYELEAHLEGIIEIGDTVRVKHPDMRVDLLTKVTAFQFDCLTFKFRRIEFGTLKQTLKGKLTEIEEKIDKSKETIKKTAKSVTKYKSEYKRDNEELVSKFISEVYGTANGVYALLEKNQSIFRQTAAEISATVSRVNADLSEDIASLVIRADSIQSTVTQNYTDLDGKIASNTSKITQTASEIRSEVNSKFTNYSTTTQMNSAITQTATAIRAEVSTAINGVTQSISVVEQTANKISWLVKSGTSASNFVLTERTISQVAETINLDGYVTFTNLSNVNTDTTINGGNITTGIIKSKNYSSNYRGMKIDLDNGTIDSKHFKIKSDGSAEFSGNMTAGLIQSSNYSYNYRGMKIDLTNGTLDSKNFKINSDGSAEFSGVYSGYMEANYIRANGYSCFKVGTSNTLTIGGISSYNDIINVRLGASNCSLGANGGTVGFFGSYGVQKRSVSTLSTSATLTDLISRLNTLINALKDYNLI